MISPEFLIASSYGAVNSNYYFNYDQAQKRCASYQEDGYPAGRWRMPTEAEVKFMMGLSESTPAKIPSLFYFAANNDPGYWCANGKLLKNNNGIYLSTTDTRNTSVRCVYDIWYWGEEHATGTAAQSAIKGDDKTNEELEALNWVNAWRRN